MTRSRTGQSRPGGGLRGQKLNTERRIAEHQQRRRPEIDPGAGSELRLIDRVEEHDLLGGDVGLDAPDRLVERIGALEGNDAVALNGADRTAPAATPIIAIAAMADLIALRRSMSSSLR